MKNNIAFLFFLIALCSCTGEDQDGTEYPMHKLVRFTVNRAANSSTEVPKDTTFGIYMVQRADADIEGVLMPSGNTFDNKKFTLRGDALTPEEKVYYPEGIQAFDVYAYTPYSAERLHGDTSLPFTVQSTQTDIADSDLLWSSLKKVVPGKPAKFTFNHVLSKIKIILTSGPDVTLTSPIAVINNTLPETSLDMQTGTIGTATGAPTAIQAQKILSTDTTAVFEAIIVPQTINKLDRFLTFVDGDKTYHYNLEETKEFKTGTAYTYHFTANSNGRLEILLTGNVGEWIPDGTFEDNLTPVENGLLFAEGVGIESGWYDLNKSWGAGGFSSDSKLCWAAVCTNMIQWWQDRYVADGGILPSSTPNSFTPGRESELYRQLAIFEEFVKEFSNTSQTLLDGVPWYFTTFLPELYPNDDPFMNNQQVKELNMVYFKKSLKEFSDFIINGFRQRGVLYLSAAAHARTVWGCKYNPDTGLVEQLYITDSDDNKVMLWEPVDITVSPTGQIMFGAVEIATLYILYAHSR